MKSHVASLPRKKFTCPNLSVGRRVRFEDSTKIENHGAYDNQDDHEKRLLLGGVLHTFLPDLD
jgi:hypothetical protein